MTENRDDEAPYLATAAELLAFQLRMIADRMAMRIEAIEERGGETVGISPHFAGEIMRACRAAAEYVAPPVPPPETKDDDIEF